MLNTRLKGRRYSGYCGGTATLNKYGSRHFSVIGAMGGRPKAKIIKIIRKEDLPVLRGR